MVIFSEIGNKVCNVVFLFFACEREPSLTSVRVVQPLGAERLSLCMRTVTADSVCL